MFVFLCQKWYLQQKERHCTLAVECHLWQAESTKQGLQLDNTDATYPLALFLGRAVVVCDIHFCCFVPSVWASSPRHGISGKRYGIAPELRCTLTGRMHSTGSAAEQVRSAQFVCSWQVCHVFSLAAALPLSGSLCQKWYLQQKERDCTLGCRYHRWQAESSL